jgi:hypothetical protein
VVNEDVLLDAISDLVSDQPHLQLYTFTGEESVQETIQLFRRAKVVAGMHGAGLSHIAFSAPGTAVVELLFMNDPPMMFWHASGALSLQYFMVPLAQSWWLESDIYVSIQVWGRRRCGGAGGVGVQEVWGHRWDKGQTIVEEPWVRPFSL